MVEEAPNSALSGEGKIKTSLEVDLKGWDLVKKDETGSEPDLAITKHSIQINGKPFNYTVTTGRLPLKDESGKPEAWIFFIEYTRYETEPVSTDRPLMFSFNGGPGSSSVWLHLGALGPKRVKMKPDGDLPPPPYKLEDNPLTWLEHTDLVFIDPVGTGYSRPASPENGKKYWCLNGDIASVGDFILRYLTKYQRWTSPLFLVGESYGTTRAAGLSSYLVDRGVAFNGILLVSSILNFQTARFAPGNDLPYVLFLPTYTATAWYHNRLAADLQADLKSTLREVEEWALGEYAAALAAGDRLSTETRAEIAQKLARYTGLIPEYCEGSNLRIEIFRFCKELLRCERRTVGRLDSRFKGIDASGVSEHPEYDPSMTAIRPPYTAGFNQYIRSELKYTLDLPYHILGGGITGGWDWNSDNTYADTGEALRKAMARNPYMRLFVASGYYDLATPYFATEYTLAHLGLDPALRANVSTADYRAGHMMYVDVRELQKLQADVAQFISTTLEAHAADAE